MAGMVRALESTKRNKLNSVTVAFVEIFEEVAWKSFPPSRHGDRLKMISSPLSFI